MSGPPVADRRGPRPRSAPANREDGSRLLVLLVIGTAAAAWLAVVFLHSGDSSSILDHHRLGAGELPAPGAAGHHHSSAASGELAGRAAAVLGAWSVMVLAMMVPPALPMLSTVRRLVSRHRNAGWLLGGAVGVFVAAWTVVGAVLIAGDVALSALTAGLGPDRRVAGAVSGAVLIGAGIYQLTPWKDRCLRACRSPRSFALAHWRGRRPPAAEVVTLAAAYALSCIGCCWALMASGFAVGVAALPAMVVLAVLMAAERLAPWGRRLVWPAGMALVAVGLASVLWPLLTVPVGA
ncbi:DUF2182 domain-containing protein [Geodermatophilus sp. URMC 62]|uniref:DUF2182 domain-containing protein n=1 Tax=Geodermatophilus sp. URMC 62 TaxID=3423414 RepID=UPI00406CC9A1